MFNRTKIFFGLPRDGDSITYKKPYDIHWFKNTVEDLKLLEIGKTYTVRRTQLNSSSTFVWLNEIEAYDKERDLPFFCISTEIFDWELPTLTEEDFLDKNIREALMVKHYHPKVGLEFDGIIYNEGTPMWVLEYNEEDLITKAYKR